MKYCSNPSCDSSFFYGDNKTVCPFCHSLLTSGLENHDNHIQPIITLDNIYQSDNDAQNHEHDIRDRFSTSIRGGVRYHGRITEIEHHEMFNSKWHKLFNSLFRGEPYQFAHQTSEYTVRLESIANGYPNEITDVCMYGNYLGRIHIGDEVTVNVKNYRNRRVANSMYNHTTESAIRPGLQLPAGMIRGIAIGIVATVVIFLLAIVVLAETGVLADWLTSLFVSLLPIVVIGIVLFAIVFGRLPWRKH